MRRPTSARWPDDVAFPRGSRVVVRVPAVDADGVKHRPGALAVVKHAEARRYTVETPAGAVLVVDRGDIALQKEDLLTALASRQWDERRLKDAVIYAAVVGSRAWGLANEASDEDVRGCFVLPFEEHASLFDTPEEIHDDERQAAHWEIGKLVRQALRADPNTLETLWSPLHKVMTPLGARLVHERGAFTSVNVVGSFGRYAHSQLHKLERAAERAAITGSLLVDIAAGRVHDEKTAQATLPEGEDVHALVRSLFDRGLLTAASFPALVDAVASVGVERLAPPEVRPKNAYNLVRLLHSCRHWLERGEPLIRVDGAVKDELLAIKEERTPLAATLARAHELNTVVEELARTSTRLPATPDFAAADALVREARRQAARVSIAAGATSAIPGPRPAADAFALRWFPAALPPDVEVGGLRRFLEGKLAGRTTLVVGLTGAHAYGFPSPDSDLDLKAIHAEPAARLLGLRPAPAPLEVVEDFEAREMDLSSHELGQAASLLLKGNGNMLERLLGPLPVVVTPAGEELAALAERTLSQRVVHHYRGFLQGMKRESDLEARSGGRTAKRLLYAYRVACTGAHLLLERKLETDVRALSPIYGFGAAVEQLVVRKRVAELSTLTEEEAAPFVADWARLDALLDDALERSPLPPLPEGADGLEAALVAWRLALHH